jgi:hypothetical protein
LLGLLLQEGFDGAFGESLGGGAGHVLHGGPVDLESGAVGPEGVAGHGFSPAFGQSADGVQVGVG